MNLKTELANDTFVIIDGDKEVLCKILFTYESEEFNKNYVVFYPLDEEADENGQIALSAAVYTPDGDGVGNLEPVEAEEEWELLGELLEEFEKNLSEEWDLEDCDDDCDDDDCDCAHCGPFCDDECDCCEFSDDEEEEEE